MRFLKAKYLTAIVLFFSSALLFPNSLSVQAKKSVMLQFITYNGFGNNLYLDNVIMGNRKNFDLAVTSFDNIPSDTTFLPGTSSFEVFPVVSVTNIGLGNVTDTFKVFLSIPELSYFDSAKAAPMNSGFTRSAEFSLVSIPSNTKITLTSYVKHQSDSSRFNDTLKQSSVFLEGAPRNMLLEEFTSATSPSCGANNFYLDTFITNNFSRICPVKYHVGFPQPGIDSMYLIDTALAERRREYYFANSAPVSIVDGRQRILLPYYLDSNLYLPYELSINTGSQVSMSVTNVQVASDTIESTININFLYPVLNKNLRLRVAAVEREVVYPAPIGASGESVFYDVCRRMFPDSVGFPLTGNAGASQFVVRFHVDSLWKDSSLYTVAFIQSDLDRTVYNSAKSSLPVFSKQIVKGFTKPNSLKPDYDFKNYSSLRNSAFKHFPKAFDTVSYFNYENFEGPFLPRGWSINNIDGFLTFEKTGSTNGVTLGGYSAVKMPFYDYSNIGQRDTLYSVSFDSVSSFDTLSFDWAYAVYLSSYSDSLTVNISADGGLTYTNIFQKGGYGLASAISTTLPFVPYSATQWRTFKYALSEVIPPENPQNIVPKDFELGQNYPNPFNPKTTIGYKIPKDAFVTIKVYDAAGRMVATLLNENKKAGAYEVLFNGANFSSGVYFYVMTAGDFSQAKKLVLLK